MDTVQLSNSLLKLRLGEARGVGEVGSLGPGHRSAPGPPAHWLWGPRRQPAPLSLRFLMGDTGRGRTPLRPEETADTQREVIIVTWGGSP